MTILVGRTNWRVLSLQVRLALAAEGMTPQRWKRLPIIRRELALLAAYDALFDMSQCQ